MLLFARIWRNRRLFLASSKPVVGYGRWYVRIVPNSDCHRVAGRREECSTLVNLANGITPAVGSIDANVSKSNIF